MSIPSSAFYRLRQFWSALRARVEPEERQLVGRYLSPPLQRLFDQLSAADQRHSLDVLYALRAQGYSDRDLLAAALLHDVGKAGANIRLWQRVAIVLLQATWPALLDELAWGDPANWRYAFYIQREHPEIGARLAQGNGASPLTVELIRRHQVPLRRPGGSLEDKFLRVLQEADGIR
jgi:hypothetical protein